MNADEFMAIAPMFASEDVTRPSLHEPFRCGDRLLERVKLWRNAEGDEP